MLAYFLLLIVIFKIFFLSHMKNMSFQIMILMLMSENLVVFNQMCPTLYFRSSSCISNNEKVI